MLFILEPNEVTRPLARKRVTVFDYPDGRLAIKHNGRLVHLLATAEGPIGQLAAVVLDRKTAIGVVEHRHTLAGEGSCHFCLLYTSDAADD